MEKKKFTATVFIQMTINKFRLFLYNQCSVDTMEKNKKKKKKSFHFKKIDNSLYDMVNIFSKIKKEKKIQLNQLLFNERNSLVSLRGRSFRVGEPGSSVQYTGLTHKLHDMFWEDTEEDPTKNKNKRPPKYKKEHYVPSSGLKSECKTNGSRHGKKVHSQIDKVVKKLREGKPLKLSSSTDPCTIRVLNVFISKRWLPVASELAIYDEESKVATAIDVVVFDIVKKELIIIELKTGYENEEYGDLEEDDRMDLINVKNSPRNRHMLQLLWMCLILKKKYGIHVDDAYILRVLPKQKLCALIAMDSWARNSDFQDSFLKSLQT